MVAAPPKPRIFSYREAVALLPEVQRITDEAYRRAVALEPRLADHAVARAELEQLVEDWTRRMQALGVEVKDLWLIDFDNGSGYYCWRYPEPALQYYHSYEDGFRGRMPIQ